MARSVNLGISTFQLLAGRLNEISERMNERTSERMKMRLKKQGETSRDCGCGCEAQKSLDAWTISASQWMSLPQNAPSSAIKRYNNLFLDYEDHNPPVHYFDVNHEMTTLYVTCFLPPTSVMAEHAITTSICLQQPKFYSREAGKKPLLSSC